VTPDLFAPAARRDLHESLTWIAKDNEAAAEAFLQAVLQSARRIVERPMLGRLRLDLLAAPYRLWRVAGFPYLIVYNGARQPPLVLRVLHMARDLGPLLADLAEEPDDGLPPA
jgi:toxin ParE1/3/4